MWLFFEAAGGPGAKDLDEGVTSLSRKQNMMSTVQWGEWCGGGGSLFLLGMETSVRGLRRVP